MMFSLCLLLCLTVTTKSSTLPHHQSPRTGRAVGVFTLDDYWHTYTQGNEDLLTYYHLHNKRMVKDNSVRPTSETIEWSQKSRCWFGCEEEYLLVDYYEDGDQSNPVMKVFVARELAALLRSSILVVVGLRAPCTLATSTSTKQDRQSSLLCSPATGTPSSTTSRPTTSNPSSRGAWRQQLAGLSGPP